MRYAALSLFFVSFVGTARAALPFCDAPPTELHKVLCVTDDASLQRRAVRLVELEQRHRKRLPKSDKALDVELSRFFDRTTHTCLGGATKAGAQGAPAETRWLPCVYDALDRELVSLSRRLIDTKQGVAPGRYRYTESKSVEGELVFLRDDDGGASVSLFTVVAGGTNVCAIDADRMQVSPSGFTWSAEEQPACRIAIDVGKKPGRLGITASAECEAFFCGNGAIFTGDWTPRP